MSEANSMDCRVGRRVRTVEYEPGWGWIARDPRTGREVLENFRWTSRSVARDVVREARALAQPNTEGQRAP
jgi:hypothetical protein